jgi:hypothetical protein
MNRGGALTIRTTHYPSIVAWIVTLFAFSAVWADTTRTHLSSSANFTINDRLLIDIECSEFRSGDPLCNFKTDMQYSKYLKPPLSAHERYLFPEMGQTQRQADLLTIVRLAVEEFRCLSNVKLYWELTEQNLEELAIKLRLKGEIPIAESGMHGSATEKAPEKRPRAARSSLKRAEPRSGALALVMPSKLKWNLGMNPNDMTVFGELNLNAYMTLSGEFGDVNRVGVYIRYTF